MAKVSIDVVANVDEAARSLKKVDDALDGVGGTGRKAGLSLTDLKSGLDMAVGAFKAVEGAVKSVIDPFVDYANQVEDLGRNAGITAKQSSLLIQVTDDLRIGYDTLKVATRELNKDGIQPTFENLKDLARQYQAIEDPVMRAKFATDHFGKSAMEMTKFLEADIEKLNEMADSVAGTALIMDEQGVQAAKNYQEALDGTQDAVLAFKIAIAQDLLPPLTELLVTLGSAEQRQRDVTAAVHAGIISQNDAGKAIRTGTLLTEEQTAALDTYRHELDEFASVLEFNTALQVTQTEAIKGTGTAYDGMVDIAIAANAAWVTNQETSMAALKAATDEVTGSMKDYNTQLFFTTASAGLDANAQLILASNLGLVDAASLTLMMTLPKLLAQYDLNGDGAVGAGEDTQGYLRALLDLETELDKMDGKTTLSTHKHVFEYVGTPPSALFIPDTTTSSGPTHYASGGSFGPGLMLVGEQGPELVASNTSGHVFNAGETRELIDAIRSIGGAMGSTYNLNMTGGGGDDVLAGFGRLRALAGAMG